MISKSIDHLYQFSQLLVKINGSQWSKVIIDVVIVELVHCNRMYSQLIIHGFKI